MHAEDMLFFQEETRPTHTSSPQIRPGLPTSLRPGFSPLHKWKLVLITVIQTIAAEPVESRLPNSLPAWTIISATTISYNNFLYRLVLCVVTYMRGIDLNFPGSSLIKRMPWHHFFYQPDSKFKIVTSHTTLSSTVTPPPRCQHLSA